ncbi:MAG: septal ring lytic transglycosylase RlpA family protein [Dissulfurispiraceae bacterium]|jgi:rare lipoprotein A
MVPSVSAPLPVSTASEQELLPDGQRSSEFETFKGEKKSCYASWYGREFHGKPTASGENFNMFALTCAHRDYPLGTKVRVTNPANSKEVECIVNDRGPFVNGRDIDLSYAAAKRIELIGPGVAKVDIEPLGRYVRYVKEVKYADLKGSIMTIQIGSFIDESNAIRLKNGLDLHYKDVYIMHANIGNDKYYRVRIGELKDRTDAVQLAEKLAQEGYSVLVTRYSSQ